MKPRYLEVSKKLLANNNIEILRGKLSRVQNPPLTVIVLIFRIVQQRCERVSLIVVGRTPQHHNHQQQRRKQNVPKRFVYPQIFPVLRKFTKISFFLPTAATFSPSNNRPAGVP
jgi:hypothetical protein